MVKRVSILTVLFITAGWLVAFQSDELAKSIKRGEEVYTNFCQSCHMDKGQGVEHVFPPLAKADFIANDKDGKKAIRAILKGLTGELIVNDKKYNVDMPPQAYLKDEQIADVLNFVRNSWGNKGKALTPAFVKEVREEAAK